MSDRDLGQRVALVTGAGRGIGRAIARRVGSDGFAVAVNDIDADVARSVADELAEEGVRAVAVAGDVSRADAVAAIRDSVADQLGHPDVLVNNAGVISAQPFTDLSEAEWDRVLGVNLKGAYLLSQAVIGEMVRRHWGRIINIASDAGKTGEPWIGHYCASKFGLIGLTQSLALEFATAGVTVNAVCPAICATEMMGRLAAQTAEIAGGDEAAARALMVAEIPMGRPTEPGEVADVVSFLASETSGFISGQAINVSGAHEVH